MSAGDTTVKREKDIIIFGAGNFGRLALAKYEGRVAYFIDNNEELWGSTLQGIAVKGVNDGIREKGSRTVVIASKYPQRMAEQLKMLGVTDYLLYSQDLRAYYETEELVINPYLDRSAGDVSETEWNEATKNNLRIEAVNDMVEQLHGKEVLFDHVEIETVNRCNGSCDFCPVSKNRDPREYKKMTEELFQNIIGQLADMNYSGKLALFSNNEPFLDEDILERHQYARNMLPNARMHLFTNGTLLTLYKFKELVQYLDELIIDNYQQELKLIKPCEEIAAYCEEHPELKKKVTIVLRKPHEILSTRGGDAPNRKEMVSYGKVRCVLPYKQLIIRPDGKVSLCCNDPLGRNTLGDLTKESIMEVWKGQRFRVIREALYQGRENWQHCRYCDAFNMG